MDEAQQAQELVLEAIRYARGLERVRLALTTVAPLQAAIDGLKEIDGRLAPELLAALDSLGSIVEAIESCERVLSTSYDLAVNPPEGGTP